MSTPLTDQQLQIMMSSLNPSRVQNRKQGGASLSYLAAYDVKATLIRLFGFGGFSSELIQADIIHQEQVPQKNGNGKNWKIAAQATVKLTIHQLGAVYTETAIAGSVQPDFTEAADMAMKSAESDAFKRAAIFLGTQTGLSLYENGSLNDVVKVVVAPGQEFRNGQRVYPTQPAHQDEGSAQEQEPSSKGVRPLSGQPLTPEQEAANQQLMDKLNRQVQEKGNAKD